jgi:uncharacterized protein
MEYNLVRIEVCQSNLEWGNKPMQIILSVFWNQQEKRLRALWRLLGQLILLVLVTLPLQLVTSFMAMGYLMTLEELPPEEAADPAMLQVFIAQSPFLLLVSSIVTLAAIILSVWVAGRLLDRRPFYDFGLRLNRNWWVDFGFGLFLGVLLVSLVFLMQLAAGWISVTGTLVTTEPRTSFLAAILVPLVTFLAVGLQEELFSRGYQLKNLAEGFNGKTISPITAILLAVILSSAVFGILHIPNPNSTFFSTLNIVLAGIFLLAMGFILTGELAIPIGVHITWNFTMGNVFGFPVSGIDFRGATFVAIEQQGPELWTGGAFGPEGGLLGVIAILLGGLLTVFWVRYRYGFAQLHQQLAFGPQRIETQKAFEGLPGKLEDLVQEEKQNE